jgi:molybdopterin molybdotransferase
MGAEDAPLLEATNRAVAVEVIALRPLPAFDNSAMDGYAVHAKECSAGAVLPVVGCLQAGANANRRLEPGTAMKIMTGAPIPAGADAIVPFEETVLMSGQVKLLGTVKTGDHIRRQGEDLRPGDLVIDAGTALRPAEISLLASFGQAMVRVGRRARVAIIATGDELQELGEVLLEGRIVNSNSWGLAAAVQELGGIPHMLGIARDNRDSLREKLSAGLQADALITSAGVSAGDYDLVREVLEELGVAQHFWKINIKPGKPTAFGMHNRTAVFSLPGNPVSALMTFEEFVRPALLKMMGHRTFLKPAFKARLQEPVSKKSGRLQLLRVALELNADGELQIASAGDQNTGIVRTLVRAQGIALLPEEREYFAAGEQLEVHLLGPQPAFRP